jgi:hypothetical protein
MRFVEMKTTILTLLFFLLSTLFFEKAAHTVQVTGSVQDEADNPLVSAVVRVQTSKKYTLTDYRGQFRLDVGTSEPVILTAWKKGYFNGGTKLSEFQSKAVINLKHIPLNDNKEYTWISSFPPSPFQKASIVFWKTIAALTGSENLKSRFSHNCSNCHSSPIVDQWRQDAHSNSAKNPILLTMYNGSDIKGNPGVFPGYKLDFPNANGNCATCHAPAQAINNPWGTDLNNVEGVAKEGVFCDFCHKIRGVELNPDGGYPGVLSIRFNRPHGGEQVFYGPFDDVTAGPDTFDPLYKKSIYCAPCHSAKFWGTPIYTDYDEWLESPYPEEGVECQGCHMTPDGITTSFVPPEKGGLDRDPETVPTHNNPGCRDPGFMSDAIMMNIDTEEIEDTLEIIVSLTNVKAGHHYPTGVPMRNMILLVEASDSKENNLDYTGDQVVPEWGGIGSPEEGNFAGLPGKGFAKILADAPKNFPKFNTNIKSPTPHWRQAIIISDNRIAARETDRSSYRFQINDHTSKDIRVTARLIYRRAFKPWIEAKGWPLEDIEIAKEEMKVELGKDKQGGSSTIAHGGKDD